MSEHPRKKSSPLFRQLPIKYLVTFKAPLFSQLPPTCVDPPRKGWIEILLKDTSYAPKLPSNLTYQNVNAKWRKISKCYWNTTKILPFLINLNEISIFNFEPVCVSWTVTIEIKYMYENTSKKTETLLRFQRNTSKLVTTKCFHHMLNSTKRPI